MMDQTSRSPCRPFSSEAGVWQLRRIGPPSSVQNSASLIRLKEEDVITIGRGPSADYFLDSAVTVRLISRIHASIRGERQSHGRPKFTIINSGLNGTYINDIKMGFHSENQKVLHEGDKITFGHPGCASIQPGEYAPQEDSEFQFIFECIPASRAGSLERQVNTSKIFARNGSPRRSSHRQITTVDTNGLRQADSANGSASASEKENEVAKPALRDIKKLVPTPFGNGDITSPSKCIQGNVTDNSHSVVRLGKVNGYVQKTTQSFNPDRLNTLGSDRTIPSQPIAVVHAQTFKTVNRSPERTGKAVSPVRSEGEGCVSSTNHLLSPSIAQHGHSSRTGSHNCKNLSPGSNHSPVVTIGQAVSRNNLEVHSTTIGLHNWPKGDNDVGSSTKVPDKSGADIEFVGETGPELPDRISVKMENEEDEDISDSSPPPLLSMNNEVIDFITPENITSICGTPSHQRKMVSDSTAPNLLTVETCPNLSLPTSNKSGCSEKSSSSPAQLHNKQPQVTHIKSAAQHDAKSVPGPSMSRPHSSESSKVKSISKLVPSSLTTSSKQSKLVPLRVTIPPENSTVRDSRSLLFPTDYRIPSQEMLNDIVKVSSPPPSAMSSISPTQCLTQSVNAVSNTTSSKPSTSQLPSRISSTSSKSSPSPIHSPKCDNQLASPSRQPYMSFSSHTSIIKLSSPVGSNSSKSSSKHELKSSSSLESSSSKSNCSHDSRQHAQASMSSPSSRSCSVLSCASQNESRKSSVNSRPSSMESPPGSRPSSRSSALGSRPSSKASPPGSRISSRASGYGSRESPPNSRPSSASSPHSRPASAISPHKLIIKDIVPHMYSSSDEDAAFEENKTNEIVKKIYSPARRKQEDASGNSPRSRRSTLFKSNKNGTDSAKKDPRTTPPALSSPSTPLPSSPPKSQPQQQQQQVAASSVKKKLFDNNRQGSSSSLLSSRVSSPSSSDLSDFDDESVVSTKKALAISKSASKPIQDNIKKSPDHKKMLDTPKVSENRKPSENLCAYASSIKPLKKEMSAEDQHIGDKPKKVTDIKKSQDMGKTPNEAGNSESLKSSENTINVSGSKTSGKQTAPASLRQTEKPKLLSARKERTASTGSLTLSSLPWLESENSPPVRPTGKKAMVGKGNRQKGLSKATGSAAQSNEATKKLDSSKVQMSSNSLNKRDSKPTVSSSSSSAPSGATPSLKTSTQKQSAASTEKEIKPVKQNSAPTSRGADRMTSLKQKSVSNEIQGDSEDELIVDRNASKSTNARKSSASPDPAEGSRKRSARAGSSQTRKRKLQDSEDADNKDKEAKKRGANVSSPTSKPSKSLRPRRAAKENSEEATSNTRSRRGKGLKQKKDDDVGTSSKKRKGKEGARASAAKKAKSSRAKKKKKKKLMSDSSSEDDDDHHSEGDDDDDLDVDMSEEDEDGDSWELPEGVQYYDNECSAKKCLNPEGKQVDWVMCDSCEQWYHVVCVDCPLDVVEKEDTQFHCGLC